MEDVVSVGRGARDIRGRGLVNRDVHVLRLRTCLYIYMDREVQDGSAYPYMNGRSSREVVGWEQECLYGVHCAWLAELEKS